MLDLYPHCLTRRDWKDITSRVSDLERLEMRSRIMAEQIKILRKENADLKQRLEELEDALKIPAHEG